MSKPVSSLYTTTIPAYIRGLQNISAILSYAEEYATANSIDPESYLSASLYPDMKDLVYQIYRMTDYARFTATRIAGTPNLSLPDTEKTYPELRDRLAKAIAYLEKVEEKDFEGKEGVKIVLHPPGPDGQVLDTEYDAVEYVNYYAHPSFFFHVSIAYGILRSKGVPIGKRWFLNAAQVHAGLPVRKSDGSWP